MEMFIRGKKGQKEAHNARPFPEQGANHARCTGCFAWRIDISFSIAARIRERGQGKEGWEIVTSGQLHCEIVSGEDLSLSTESWLIWQLAAVLSSYEGVRLLEGVETSI